MNLIQLKLLQALVGTAALAGYLAYRRMQYGRWL